MIYHAPMFESTYIYVFIVIIALLWDTIIPDATLLWQKIPHPIVILGKLISRLESIIYAQKKSTGAMFSLCIITLWGGIGFGIEYILFSYTQYGVISSIIIVSITLASRAMITSVKRVMIAIDRNDISLARLRTGDICTRDTSDMETSDCGRTALESMAENISDGVIAPAFYYAIFGLGGLFIYKSINTLDSMVGYTSAKYKNFGWASARLDDIMNFIPARISAVCIVIATIIYTHTRTQDAIICVHKYAHTHNSPNAGYPESAFAGGLNIAFGGKRTYPSIGEIDHWIGDNKRDITPKIMMAGIGLFKYSIYVFAGILAVILTYALPTI